MLLQSIKATRDDGGASSSNSSSRWRTSWTMPALFHGLIAAT